MKKIVIPLLVLIVAIAAFVGVISFINYHRTFVVLNGPAMQPAIKSGQEVRVHAYPNGQLPHRGDIVEYTSTNKLALKYVSSGKLIHRVIALPGEKITIGNNVVTVFNKENPNGFNPDTKYIANNITTTGNVSLTLGAGMYYVMGDNRSNSLDSRSIGPISENSIIGQVSTQLPSFLSNK